MERETEVEIREYNLVISGSDPIGLNFMENVVEMANLGARIKPGAHAQMRFPHGVNMVLKAENPPVPTATIRVFDAETNKEIFAAFVPQVKAAEFSLDIEDEDDEEADNSGADLSTNNGTPWTREQLDAMHWTKEFKQVCKSVGIKGRDRDQMTKEYLAKFS